MENIKKSYYKILIKYIFNKRKKQLKIFLISFQILVILLSVINRFSFVQIVGTLLGGNFLISIGILGLILMDIVSNLIKYGSNKYFLIQNYSGKDRVKIKKLYAFEELDIAMFHLTKSFNQMNVQILSNEENTSIESKIFELFSIIKFGEYTALGLNLDTSDDLFEYISIILYSVFDLENIKTMTNLAILLDNPTDLEKMNGDNLTELKESYINNIQKIIDKYKKTLDEVVGDKNSFEVQLMKNKYTM